MIEVSLTEQELKSVVYRERQTLDCVHVRISRRVVRRLLSLYPERRDHSVENVENVGPVIDRYKIVLCVCYLLDRRARV